MTVRRLLKALDATGIDATDKEVVEALWLAVQIAQRTSSTNPTPADPSGAKPSRSERTRLPTPSSVSPRSAEKGPAQPQRQQDTHASLSPPRPPGRAGDRNRRDAIVVRTPAVSALPNGPDILRALRPLKRRVPSKHDFVLDEDATADRIADEKLVAPVMRPAQERWLTMALVTDTGPSMVIWQSLAAELRVLFERLGAFRDIRVWHLHTTDDNSVGIHPKIVPTSPLHSPSELIDSSGSQVVLMISDCVDKKWRNGLAHGVLDIWGRTGPLAILQPLPQRLWQRSGARPVLARIQAAQPGLPNSRLLVEPHVQMPRGPSRQDLAVPVMEIEADWLASWARLITGTASGGIDGAVMLARPGAQRPFTVPDEVSLSPYDRVFRFRAAASPEAYQLAGYFAAAPLSLPVMRLVQRVMMPATRPSHLAEVFVGGLLRRIDDAGINAEFVQYDFIDGVRDVLLGTIRKSEAMRVFEETSAYVSSHIGQSRDTSALLNVPTGRGDQTSSTVQPFASVPREVIKRLGGRFDDPLPQRSPRIEHGTKQPRQRQPTEHETKRPPEEARPSKYAGRGGPPIEHVDAVIVGSGFGGSVAAYRLAEAGRSVVVLERGRDYPPGSFARTPAEMSRAFWDPAEGLYGLFDVWGFRGFDSVVSSGLGGGSLIDANVLMRKDEKWFVEEDPIPGGGYESWPVSRADLDPHYDAVEKMLGATPYPLKHPAYAATPKTHAMSAAAAELGLDWHLPPLAVSFAPQPGAEPGIGLPLQDADYGNVHELPRMTCRLCGECNIGCNDGAKNSLDYTYLSAARHHGADLRTLHEVKGIRPRPEGGYEVDFVVHDPLEKKARRRPLTTISCDRLVLAAGTYGTSYLLLRDRERFPGLSSTLGTRFSGNGDLLTFLMRAKDRDRLRPLNASRGPVITSAIRLPDELDGVAGAGRGAYIEDGGYPAFVNWLVEEADVKAEIGRVVKLTFERFLAFISHAPQTRTSKEISELIGDGALSMSSLPLLGMGRDVPDGVLRLKGGNLDVDWTTETSEAYFERMRTTMQRIAAVLGAKYADNPIWFRKRIVTVHPVGGAPMGRHPGVGVCDPYGEVHGFPGLYVADGAAMPGAVGANPSLTIAAMADRMSTRLLETAGPSRSVGRAVNDATPEPEGPGPTSLSFTEEMSGFYADGVHSPGAGETAGEEAGQRLGFHLTITVDDVERFLEEPGHTARAEGWIDAAGCGGRCHIERGWFNLFSPGDAPDRRLVRYRLQFTDSMGRPRTLSGWKDVRHGTASRLWPETTTLYFRLFDGHLDGDDEEEAAIAGAGILHLGVDDFAKQLTTFRTDGPHGTAKLERFARFFLGELWELYRPTA